MNTASPGPERVEPARALADALLGEPADARAAAGLAPELLRAAAWLLKTDTQAAWTADPPRTARCATAVAALYRQLPEPELQALAEWSGAIAGLAGGQMALALERLQRAQALFAGLGQAAAAAETQVPQVVALAMLGRHDDALVCGQRAIAELQAVGNLHAAARVELNLGTMLFRRHRHAEAARAYRSAGVRFARARHTADSIVADIGLASALTWLSDFDEAQRIHERARRRAEQHGLKFLHAQARLAIGRLELIRGRWHRALREMATAVTELDAAGASPQLRLEASLALADAYLGVNLLPEAEALYAKAVEAAQALGARSEEARARLERARVQARAGHEALARQGLSQAEALFRALGNDASAADAQLLAAQIDLDRGDADAALQHANAAAAGLKDSGIDGMQLQAAVLQAAAAAALGDSAGAARGFADALVRASALGLLPPQLAARVGLGALALQAGRLALAAGELRSALELVDAACAALVGDEFRAAAAGHAERAHDLLVSATSADPAAGAGACLEAIEQGRARALTLALTGSHGAAAGTSSPVQAAQSARVQWLRTRWRSALAEGDTASSQQHADAVRQIEAELLEAHRRQTLQALQQSLPVGAAAPFRAAVLQRQLQPDQALVAWHLDGDSLLAVVARRSGIEQRRWAVPGLREAIDGLRFQLDTPRFNTAVLQDHAVELLRRVCVRATHLHTLLWAPLVPLLAGCQRVTLVPHRVLHYVPWAALHDGQSWLAEQLEISVAHSAQAWLVGARAPVGQPSSVLALGTNDPSLPEVRTELDAIEAAFGPGLQRLEGSAATAAALREHAGRSQVLHLACHGLFRADNPAFSALALADGPLPLLELSGLQLNGALVVLSACETAVSRVAPGDELVGLVRGFTLAGARAVLATRWAVSDRTTAPLMGAFYAELAAGRTPAQALHHVVARAARHGVHPFHWGAWALFGAG